ncbi:MAG: ATP-grasp domain-containing protein [Dermatophilaceae bacterium]
MTIMQRPVVAIVDAFSTARHLAPLFRAAGYDCVHVQSTADPPALFAASFQPEDFLDTVEHTGDLNSTVDAIRPYAPVALLAGAECGVELADALSEAIGVRTNGTGLSAARRDKFRMVETVKAAGLSTADQILATDLDTVLGWYGDTERVVVLKPLRGALNDGVHFCATAAEVRSAFETLTGRRSALGQGDDGVVAQEYLVGAEYYVNTVSMDGKHYVCDLWRTHHLRVNGVRDLLGGSQLMAREGQEQDVLVKYVGQVLNALGVMNGPAHTEVKLAPGGPHLIETGARVCGAELPLLTRAALGSSQLEWTVTAYTDPDTFLANWQNHYQMPRHAVCVNMIAPSSGTLIGYPRMNEIEGLESYHTRLTRIGPGQELPQTVNDMTYPLLVHLMHEVEGVIMRDYMTARYLDGEGFYHVA